MVALQANNVCCDDLLWRSAGVGNELHKVINNGKSLLKTVRSLVAWHEL